MANRGIYDEYVKIGLLIGRRILNGTFSLINHHSFIHRYYNVPIKTFRIWGKNTKPQWIVVIYDKEVLFGIKEVLVVERDSSTSGKPTSVNHYSPNDKSRWKYFVDFIVSDKEMNEIKMKNMANFTLDYYNQCWKNQDWPSNN